MANRLLGNIANPRRISVLDSAQGARQLLGGVGAQGLQNEITGLTGGIQQAQLSGQAPEQDSIRRLGQIAPEVKAQFAQVFGIPANEQERLMGFAQDIGVAAKLAKVDPDDAYRYIVNRRNELRAFGQDTAKTDQLIDEFERGDVDLAVANLDSLSQSLQETGFLPTAQERIIKQSEISKSGQVSFQTPGGGLEARDVAGFRGEQPEGDKPRSKADTQKQLNILRRDVKDISTTFRSIEEANNKIKSIGNKGTAASDLALIFSFMKILDPTSVVRESEQASAANARGVPEAIRAKYNKMLTGEKLGINQRKDFIAQAKDLFKAQRDATDNQIDNILQQADQDSISRLSVLGKSRLKSFDERRKALAPKVGTPQVQQIGRFQVRSK